MHPPHNHIVTLNHRISSEFLLLLNVHFRIDDELRTLAVRILLSNVPFLVRFLRRDQFVKSKLNKKKEQNHETSIEQCQ